MSARSILLVACLLAPLPVAERPVAVRACAIDDVASLSANGVPAMLASVPPSGAATWAPFVLAQAFAPGVPLRLEEGQADLARTLPATVRAAPFRWEFGDGTMAFGHTALHRYAHPGRYHILVYGYYERERRWFLFDSALVHVVPSGQLLQANLEYEALQAVIALSSLTWPLDAALLCLVAVMLLRLHGRHADGRLRLRLGSKLGRHARDRDQVERHGQ